MTREDVIRMAREADIDWYKHWNDDETNRLEIFAQLVATHVLVEPCCGNYDECQMVCMPRAAAAEREHYDRLFEQIKGWCDAYPISVFPEPDFKKAHEVLKANGMTLDSISASNMKHVITQVQKMIDDVIRARAQQ